MTAGQVEGRGSGMPGVSRIGAAMASTLILLAPAIWNRFPLLQYDTGGYLVRWFEGYLVPSRSTVFGLFLNIFATSRFLAGGRAPGRADGLGAGAAAARARLRRPAAAAARRHGGAVRPHHLAVAHQHSADRHLRRPRRAGGASSGLRRRRAAPLGAQRPRRADRVRGRHPQRDLRGHPGAARRRRAGVVVFPDRRGLGHCARHRRGRARRGDAASAPTTWSPDGSPGRPAASRCRSAACSRTASSTATWPTIARSSG